MDMEISHIFRNQEVKSNTNKQYNNHPSRRCLHFEVVGGLEWSNDPESYAGGSVATGRASLAGKVKGDDPD